MKYMGLKNFFMKRSGADGFNGPGLLAHDLVFDRLEYLPENYTVFCDVDSEHGRIEFVVETDQGSVVLIESRDNPGQVGTDDHQLLINGVPDQTIIPLVAGKTSWLKDFIVKKTGRKVWVHAALVFANTRIRPFQLSHVNIMNQKHLLKFIDKHKADKGIHMPPGAVQRVQKLRPDFLK